MRKVLSTTVLVCALTTATALATDVYTNEGDFLANIQPDYYLEEFDGFTYGSYTEPSIDMGPVNGWSYTISAAQGLWSGDGNMSTNSSGDPLVVDFTGRPVTAVGGWFFGGEIMGSYIPATITIDLSDGTNLVFDPPNDTTFRGFTTTGAPITQMTIAADSPSEFAWPTMDHFYVGAVIPEPGSIMLLALGALATMRRR